MKEKYLYIVFSSTPYRIGSLIRKITREPHNHVSIALDEKLTKMYGFARRYYHTPFYGGFVKESVSRYHVKGSDSQIRLCRIPITQLQYKELEQRIQSMLERQEHYLYNHLSAITSLIRRPVKVKDAYICVEFCVQILHTVGIDIDPEKYYSVGDLENMLMRYSIYTGPMPDSDIYDTVYYAPKPIPHPVFKSICSFFALFRRIGQ